MASTGVSTAEVGVVVDGVRTPGAASCVADLPSEDQELFNQLVELGQGHLFAQWKAGKDTAARRSMFASIRETSAAYPGGIAAYISNARKFLRAAAAGDNPFEGLTPAVPSGEVMLQPTPAMVHELETEAVSLFKDCAFVVVAGGLGERLGYRGIKLALPTTLASNKPYLQLYIEQILALQSKSNAAAGLSEEAGNIRRVPLAIMTSDDTHDKTQHMLRVNNNFGMAPGQIIVMKQEKVPALVDNNATIAMDGPYSIITKPHGHGDVHTLLARLGIAARWAEEGRKFICFFQDTNAACFDFVPRALGVAHRRQYEVMSLCIPRKAGEAIGAIATLRRADGSSMTCNVEYNQLEPLLVATVNKDGDVNDPATGFSPFPGNVNQLIFAVQPYAKVLARTGGLVPEFVNPKYADDTRTKFVKPTRLECMMQDHPKVLGPTAKVGFVTFPVYSFSPVKNSIEGGLGLSKAGLRTQTALAGEMEVYGLVCRRLQQLGVQVGGAVPFTASGITDARPAGIVLSAAMTVTQAALADSFPSPARVSITQRSFLVVRGGGTVVFHSLRLDGALVIDVPVGQTVEVRDLVVRNSGWDFELLDASRGAPGGGAAGAGAGAGGDAGAGATPSIPDSLRIRGYRLVKTAALELAFDRDGLTVREVSSQRRATVASGTYSNDVGNGNGSGSGGVGSNGKRSLSPSVTTAQPSATKKQR